MTDTNKVEIERLISIDESGGGSEYLQFTQYAPMLMALLNERDALQAKLKEAQMKSIIDLGQAQDAYEALGKARNDALREAAKMASTAHLVPPDGGSPTENECQVAMEVARQIIALIKEEVK